MAKYYYQNAAGERVELRGRDVKRLAANGTITPYTLIEYENGKKYPAKKVLGLQFGPPRRAETCVQEPEATSIILPHQELSHFEKKEKTDLTGKDIRIVIGGVLGGILLVTLVIFTFAVWLPAAQQRAQETRARIAAEQLEREEQERQRIAVEQERQRIVAEQEQRRIIAEQRTCPKITFTLAYTLHANHPEITAEYRLHLRFFASVIFGQFQREREEQE